MVFCFFVASAYGNNDEKPFVCPPGGDMWCLHVLGNLGINGIKPVLDARLKGLGLKAEDLKTEHFREEEKLTLPSPPQEEKNPS